MDERYLEPIDERHISGIEIDDSGAISSVIQGSGNVTLVDGGKDGMDFGTVDVSLLVRITMEKDGSPDNMAETDSFGLEERGNLGHLLDLQNRRISYLLQISHE